MKIVVRVPGSCGELVQGWSEGSPFLGTCPINKYTTVEVSSDFSGRYGLGEKSLLALSLTLSRLGKTDFPYGIRLTSELPRGKGMASSSADIAAVVVAVMEILGQPWTEQFIMDIATAIEPTDGVFCPGIVLMNHITGQVLAGYRQVPALQAAVFDLGGTVNTCELHTQVIVDKSKIDSQAMAAMLAVFREAMTAQDGAALARAATQSAFLNQDNLYKQELTALWQLGKAAGALGVNVAHSGTVIGLWWPAQTGQEEISRQAEDIARQLAVSFRGIVQLRPGGVEVRRT